MPAGSLPRMPDTLFVAISIDVEEEGLFGGRYACRRPSVRNTAHLHRLRALMERHGWKNLPEEWWHYTLVNEPYPDQYFDVPVRKN